MLSQFLSQHSHALTEFAMVFVFIIVLFKAVDIFDKKIKAKILEKKSDTTLLSFLPMTSKGLKFVILFIAGVSLLQAHGYSITSLIAGFGITGLAVGFGAKETISNIFGSFSLLADKAYGLGDYIIINQTVQDKPVEGIVEEINLRSTKIRCADNGLIIVPNNIVANGVVKNVTVKA